jgi:hypothetical protein
MEENESLIRENGRPFFLSILCVAVFVYSVVFVLIFSALAVFNNWFKFVLTDFLPELEIARSKIIWFAVTGIVFYSLSFAGAFLMWKLKRLGFYIYVAASAMISIVPYLFGLGGITNVIVFSILTISFLFFFRKLD